MKLLPLSLLVVLAFLAGIVVYRSMVLVPAPYVAPTNQWPARTANVVLAKGAEYREPTTMADAVDASVDFLTENQAKPFDASIVDGPIEDGFELHVDAKQPETFDAVEATNDAVHPAGDVVEGAIQFGPGEDARVVHGDEPPSSKTPGRPATSGDAENPIPDFLRGQQLPPLIPGQKVVTIQVPVENWVDLGWGDIVRVDFEQGPMYASGPEGTSLTADSFTLQVVAEAEIYALPQIAPEHSDTVPVCLKLTTKDAKELLILRKNPGKYTLTVVRPHAAQSVTYESAPTPVGAHDDFAIPVRRPDPVPDVSTNSEPTRPKFAVADPTPDDAPVHGRTSDLDPAPSTYSAPESRPLSDDFGQLETARSPLDVPVRVDESSSRPGDDFNPQPVDEPQPHTRSPPDDTPDLTVADADALPDELNISGRDDWNNRTVVGLIRPETSNPESEANLPAIDPSPAGTVHRLDGEGRYAIDAGDSLLLESPGKLKFLRISGFDTRLIRVTAESPRLLKVEGVTGGETAMIVELSDRVIAPFSVQVEVNTKQVLDPFSSKRRTTAAEQEEERKAQQRKEIETVLQDLYPDADLKITLIRDSLLLRGTVPNSDVIDEITQVAEQFAPKVLNQLRVAVEAPPARAIPHDSAKSPARTPSSSGVEIPSDLSVVVLDGIGTRQVRGREPRTLVDVYRYAPAEFEKVFENVALLGTHTRSASASLLVTPEQETTLTEHSDEYGPRWWLVPHGVQPVPDSVPIDANGAPVSDPRTGEPASAGRIPANRRVVVIRGLDDDSLQQLVAMRQVDLGRRRVFTRVVEKEGHNVETAEIVFEGVARDATVLSVSREHQTACVAVNAGQFGSLLDVPANELQVSASGSLDVAGPTPDRGGFEESPDSATAGQSGRSITLSDACRVSIDAAGRLNLRGCTTCHMNRTGIEQWSPRTEDPLRNDIRALHDDVRKLIALLEHRLSDRKHTDAHEHDPGNGEHPEGASPPSTYKSDDTTYKSDAAHSEPADPPPAAEAQPDQTESSAIEGSEAELKPEPVEKAPAEVEPTMTDFRIQVWDTLGVRISPLPAGAPELKNQPYRGGLHIDEVRPGSPFAHAGARTGDVLVGLHIWETINDESLQFVLNHRDAGHPSLKFYLLRNGETLYGNVSLDRSKADPTSKSSSGMDQKPRALDIAFAIPLYESGAPAAVVPVSRALSAFDAVEPRTFFFHVGFTR